MALALQFRVPVTPSTVRRGGAVQPVLPAAFSLVELLDIRSQLHVMTTTVAQNVCNLTAGLLQQVQGLIDAHRHTQRVGTSRACPTKTAPWQAPERVASPTLDGF